MLLGEVPGAAVCDVGVGDQGGALGAGPLEGELAGEALRVAGIFKTASREIDRSTVFVRLEEGQALLGLGEAVSEIVAVAESRKRVPGLRDALAARLAGDEVRSWDQLQPLLVYMIDVFDQSAILVYAAVFVAMAFGIANVLLMTVYERTREIGVMRAIGFGRGRLVATIVAEAVIVTGVGLATGFGLALGGVAALADGIDLSMFAEGLEYFGVSSTIVPVLRTADFTGPTWVALVTAVVASAWPAWRAVRLRPAEAVRHT